MPVVRPWRPVLLALFVASGCSALIYEIVWYQLLQLVIGSTAVSLGVLLATFMGGLCIGSLALPRLLSSRQHPLKIYGLIELGIGICGILTLFGRPYLDLVYVAGVGHGAPAMLLRAGVAAVCLLPPTVLMGASLPAAARWIGTTKEGVSWLGLLYAGNTIGAVLGCLLAGFLLLRVFDMATATYAAAAINALVALVSLRLAARTQYQAPTEKRPESQAIGAPRPWPVYTAIALSGACALGAEVVWTRLLGLLLGATVYTFSVILAVFLAGLGMGSSAGSLLSRRMARPRLALGICQLLLTAAIAWAAYTIAVWLPYWPARPLGMRTPWFTFETDLMRCLWAIFPSACLWGASFPLALAALASQDEDPGRMVGSAYAANTIGAIVGALGFSLLTIPWIGTRDSERLLLELSAVSGLLMLAAAYWPLRNKVSLAALLGCAAAAGLLAWWVPGVPPALIAYGRRMATSASRSNIIYVGEGLNSSIAISDWDDGALQFHVSGKVEASTEPFDMRLQRMLGHLPALFHRQPRTVLVVGFGAGVTAGCFTIHPGMRRIVICEMEPLVPRVATVYFRRENYNVLNDQRVQMVYDDARHYILTSPEKFDIITSDPIHPWVKGSATLYSQEYFAMVKQHLNLGGIVTQWVPLYESDPATVKSEIATFFDAFPNGTIWGNENKAGGYDLVLLGQIGRGQIDLDELAGRLSSPGYAEVSLSLYEAGFRSMTGVLATYSGRAADLGPWLAGAEINRDLNLRLQYLAGMALNYNQEQSIYQDILRHRRFPEGFFVGDSRRLEVLKDALGFGGN
jgi:spermidine synthase